MSVKWNPIFRCDKCGFEEAGKPTESMVYNTPSVHSTVPTNWFRTFGYELCPKCSFELQVRQKANRMVNHMIHAAKQSDSQYREIYNELWQNYRRPIYRDLHKWVKGELGEREG